MPITTPTELSGLHLWLDAQDSSTLTLSGNEVTQWRDKSGGSRHIGVGIGAPLINSDTINNNQAIHIPSSAVMVSESNFAALSQPYTIFLVLKLSDTPNQNWLWASVGSRLIHHGNSSQMDITFGTTVQIYDHNEQLVKQVYTLVGNGASSSVRANGVEVLATDLGSNSINNDIFSGYGATSTGYGDHVIGEVIRYDRLLTTQETLDVEAYIEARWADAGARVTLLPPTGWDYIEMGTTTVPADSVVYGDTFAAGDQVAYETTANHTNGSTGVVNLDQFGVPDITGTSEPGTWTFDYKIKDANGDNSSIYTASIVVSPYPPINLTLTEIEYS